MAMSSQQYMTARLAACVLCITLGIGFADITNCLRGLRVDFPVCRALTAQLWAVGLAAVASWVVMQTNQV